jgi:hypothetical protein
MCCDALPQTTKAPEMTGALQTTGASVMYVIVFLCSCIVVLALVLMRVCAQNNALGQKVDALGKKIDATAAKNTQQEGDAKMQEMDLLGTKINDLGQTMEKKMEENNQNMKALLAAGMQPERNTAGAQDGRLEVEIADTVDFEDLVPRAKGLENLAAEDVQLADTAVGQRFPFSCAPCQTTGAVASAVPLSSPASSTR